eukprot:gene13885-16379_t
MRRSEELENNHCLDNSTKDFRQLFKHPGLTLVPMESISNNNPWPIYKSQHINRLTFLCNPHEDQNCDQVCDLINTLAAPNLCILDVYGGVLEMGIFASQFPKESIMYRNLIKEINISIFRFILASHFYWEFLINIASAPIPYASIRYKVSPPQANSSRVAASAANNYKMTNNGNCFAVSSSEARQKSKEIDKSIQKESSTPLVLKLLLLGASDSGKSTLFKQMKIIQENGGFSEKELEENRVLIFENIISQMNILLEALYCDRGSMSEPGDDLMYFDDPLNFERGVRVKHAYHLLTAGETLTDWPIIISDIIQLWQSCEIQHQFNTREDGTKNFQLNDSAPYFLSNLGAYSTESFIPTEQDVLRIRTKTTSVTEADYTFRGLRFKMVDVGGQKSYRRKWIHCFDNVSAVLFVASLNSYDQVLEEDGTTNRLQDSLQLFNEIANSKWFEKSAMVLFLNKTDLFKDKIKRIPLSRYFNFPGPASTKSAATFISNLFSSQIKHKRQLYLHLTCAVDTTNVKFVFQSVIDDLLKKSLEMF